MEATNERFRLPSSGALLASFPVRPSLLEEVYCDTRVVQRAAEYIAEERRHNAARSVLFR